jgi:ABC-type multidrug transport system ATPase subunit
MSLLELDRVSKRFGRGLGERVALRDVSLTIEEGELVTIWGLRRSGRTTLLRVAAGIEAPDSGCVRFDDRGVTDRGDEVLGCGIGYCQRSFRPTRGQNVLDQLIVGQLARGVTPALAASRAQSALERANVTHCATFGPSELDSVERVRASIAEVLALQPKLLVIDEPTLGVDLNSRDEILLLLRSLADDGIAVLASTGETTCLSGSDRALSLGKGELHGPPPHEMADVLPLRRPGMKRAHS